MDHEPLFLQLDRTTPPLSSLLAPQHRLRYCGSASPTFYAAFHLGGDRSQPSLAERTDISTAALYRPHASPHADTDADGAPRGPPQAGDAAARHAEPHAEQMRSVRLLVPRSRAAVAAALGSPSSPTALYSYCC